MSHAGKVIRLCCRMTNTFIKNDPAKALKYFEVKMAFTTGPVELNRAINDKQDLVVVDVRAAEDFEQGHISPETSEFKAGLAEGH